MSHNCRLKTKTQLRRTGIKSKRWNGAIGEQPKPRQRLNRKSKTNSNRHVDLKCRRAYMAKNVACEMLPLFPANFGMAWIPLDADGDETGIIVSTASTDPHHILWGQARRHDIRANLLAICRESHDFCHRWKVDGLVIALEVKRRKGELDWTELDRISGKSIRGYLSTKRCDFPWCEVYRLALVGEESC